MRSKRMRARGHDWRAWVPLVALCLGAACGSEHEGAQAPGTEAGGSRPASSSPSRPAPSEAVGGGWSHSLGGPEDDTATSVAVGRDGDVVTVVSGTPRQDEDRAPVPGERLAVTLSRYAADGVVRWAREFPRERLADLRVAAVPGGDGASFLSGNSFLYPANFGQGPTDDAFLVRFDADGRAQWQRRVGQKVWAVAADGAGGAVVAAEEWKGETQDPVLTHLGADGAVRWTRRFSGTEEGTALRAVGLTPSGRTVVAGPLVGTLEVDGVRFGAAGRRGFVLLAFDDAGKLAWGREVPGVNGRVTSLAVGADGAVVVTGDFTGQLAWGGTELGTSGPFVLGAGAEGEARWLKQPACGQMAGPGPSVAVGTAGSVAVTCGDLFSRYAVDGTPRDTRTIPATDCVSGTCTLATTGVAAEPEGGFVVSGWQRDGKGDAWDQDGFLRFVPPE
ncbi:hypothetical protein LY474_22690 [Myxococcus stipitatus]|uniref:hypothetical protein n=1 Tax=Myxococcus stipitatus TaxID=83455 RepID=UPI001F2B85B8|nr:hypothetical protein [Myxococcus stipitatus]MCE9670618.1 hypothetical protein [Myxococcus stipitatus]